jgi:CBS domain-containing protein
MVDDDAVLAALMGVTPVHAPSGVPTVDDLMTRAPLTIDEDARLDEAAETMAEAGVRHLPVVDAQRRLVGMLSDRDLRLAIGVEPREWYQAAEERLTEPVNNVMSVDPVSLVSRSWLDAALSAFSDEGVGTIPVVDEDDRVIGMLSYLDVLHWLAERAAEVVSTSEAAPQGGAV